MSSSPRFSLTGSEISSSTTSLRNSWALRLLLMMLAYETILLIWLNFYGYLVSRAGQSRFGTRVRDILHGVTGVVLIALGVRLAWEHQ